MTSAAGESVVFCSTQRRVDATTHRSRTLSTNIGVDHGYCSRHQLLSSASEKNILNESAPLFISQCTPADTQHTFVSVNRPRPPEQHKTIISNLIENLILIAIF